MLITKNTQTKQFFKMDRQEVLLTVFIAMAAFMTYLCAYAFRKPFTAGSYSAVSGWEFALDFKVAMVIAQVLGYMFSKFIGIKVVSEMSRNSRTLTIFLLLLTAELSLVLFALTPAPYNLIWLFINGLPLGMIWGLVFGFVEGRRTTEVLGACLGVTFIVASGWVRTVGQWLIIDMGVPEMWMPATAGALFIPLLIASVIGLSRIPAPNQQDVEARQLRQPMDKHERRHFFLKFAPGIIMLVLAFMLLTGIRDFRDNFESELWASLGYEDDVGIFAYIGVRVAFFVLLALALMGLIKSNTKAFYANHMVILIGMATVGIATFLFQSELIDAKSWMIALGAGLYTAYIPFNCFMFDRMIASLQVTANAGFVMYLADSAGYLGSVGIMLFRVFGQAELSWLEFFINTTYIVVGATSLLILGSWNYFYRVISLTSSKTKTTYADTPILVRS
ncbi:MAG: DUF5690 family protein [Shewanella sp.]